MAVHFYAELEVIGSCGVPVPQLRLLRKLIKRRIDFNRVKKSDVLLQVVVRRVIKNASPMIVMPAAATQIDLGRLLTLRLVLASHATIVSSFTDNRIAKV